MNHRPFEDWLLDDQSLTPEQQRDLQAHLRSCSSCTAIAESNLALHSARQIAPAAGFSERFQIRLVKRREEQRWRQIIGSIILVLAGLGLLAWLLGPTILSIMQSPAEWLTSVVGYFLFIVTSIQALSEIGSIFWRILPDFLSPADWMVFSLVILGLSAGSVLSIRRGNRVPQGV